MNIHPANHILSPNKREKRRHFFLLLILGVAVAASPALERLYPGIYRSFTYVYLALLVFLFYEVINKSKFIPVRLPGWVKSMFLLIALMTGMSFGASNLIDALADTTRIFFIPILLVMFWRLELNGPERLWGAWGIIIGSFVFLLVLLSNDFSIFNSPDRFTKLINRNLMGSVFVSGFAAALYVFQGVHKYKTRFRRLLMVIMLFFVYLTLFTFSRSSLLGLILILIAYLLTSRKKKNALWLSFLLIGFGGYVTQNIKDYSGLLKLKEKKIEQVSSGRLDIWRGIWDSLPDTYFLGIGTSMAYKLLENNEAYNKSDYGKYVKGYTSTHNMPLKILAENGLIGFALYLIFTYGLLQFAWKCRKFNFILLGAALFSTTFVLFHDYTIAPWFIVALMLPIHETRAQLEKQRQIAQNYQSSQLLRNSVSVS